MSEPEKPKRRWFQFHLSTTIVLVVVAAMLIGVNLTDGDDHTPRYCARSLGNPIELYDI